MDDVLFFKIIVFHGWNNAHRRGMRVEVTKFSTWGDDFYEIVTRTTWKTERDPKSALTDLVPTRAVKSNPAHPDNLTMTPNSQLGDRSKNQSMHATNTITRFPDLKASIEKVQKRKL